MHVFNLPSYPYVIKVIKDEFGHSKSSDRATVKRKFLMVKEIDRVGRMADTLEFKNLALPRSRFAPELLEQLLALAPSTVTADGENVIIGHCYVERRMTPLNLYLETATPEEVEDVVREYGDTIRDLAIANVFAGDMLWRNFGVNRHGRVVFYDYDEIEYLTDCVFRAIPPAPNPEAELSGEPWYPVGPLDVFPEEFETFLLGSPKVREAFMRHHADLLRPEFWQRCQEQVAGGEIVDFWPYPEALRFGRRLRWTRGGRLPSSAADQTRTSSQIPGRAAWCVAPTCLVWLPAGQLRQLQPRELPLRQARDEIQQCRTAPRAGEQDPAGDDDRGHRDDLTAQHDPVDVDRRLPGHLAVLDDPRSARAGHHAEAPASAGLAGFVVTHAATAATADGCGGNHREPVLLVRVAVDALDAHDLAGAREQLLDLHDSSSRIRSRHGAAHRRASSGPRCRTGPAVHPCRR